MTISTTEAISVAGTEPAGRPRRRRASDGGPELLPDMEHIVTLVRRTKRPDLLKTLIERCNGLSLPEGTPVFESTASALPVASRRAWFKAIASLPDPTRAALERAAERILLMGDEYGVQAVQSLLDQHAAADARMLSPLSDKHSRALYLFLRQEYPEVGTTAERRFDRAERLQTIHRRWKSERYASHFQGPKGITPHLDAAAEDAFRDRIIVLYPHVVPEDILIEHFTRRDLAHADRCEGKDGEDAGAVDQHTVTVTFNGMEMHYTKVVAGEEIEHDDLAALSIVVSFEPATGALSVFTEDEESRPELAAIFRDIALATDGAIADLPLRTFDLGAFSTPAMLQRLVTERVVGIESITLLELTVAKPFEQRSQVEAADQTIVQHLASQLRVTRDRRDTRNVYTVAYEDYALDDLSQFKMTQVKLVVRIAQQSHRRAHNVTFAIRAPNRFPRHQTTADDYKRIMAQLVHLGVATEF